MSCQLSKPCLQINLLIFSLLNEATFHFCSFIDIAYNEGIPVIILTAYSKSGEEIARYIPVNIRVIPQLEMFFCFG